MVTEPVPTAEDKAKYDAAKKDLMHAISKKRLADEQLAAIEVQIYNTESQYFLETAAHSGGNIVRDFNAYLKNAPVCRRKYEIGDADRLFSNSSASYKKVWYIMLSTANQ
ncbi:histone acetyltransferase subunit NuA4-domain-containing protein [Irpex lacteus]|nr:histone acetyltransferase subunit NuA4-domain-containing protein [Irpex lacteus]